MGKNNFLIILLVLLSAYRVDGQVAFNKKNVKYMYKITSIIHDYEIPIAAMNCVALCVGNDSISGVYMCYFNYNRYHYSFYFINYENHISFIGSPDAFTLISILQNEKDFQCNESIDNLVKIKYDYSPNFDPIDIDN